MQDFPSISIFLIIGNIFGSILFEIACPTSLKVLSETSCPLTEPSLLIPKYNSPFLCLLSIATIETIASSSSAVVLFNSNCSDSTNSTFKFPRLFPLYQNYYQKVLLVTSLGLLDPKNQTQGFFDSQKSHLCLY